MRIDRGTSWPGRRPRRAATGAAIVALLAQGCIGREGFTTTICFGPDCSAAADACRPTACAAQGKNCGSLDDGCGETLDCGECSLPDICAGAGEANVCGSPACASEPLRATGTTHFVCDCGPGADAACQAGDDALNDGLAAAKPWRSYQKARTSFRTMNAGDTIALCRGGSFDAAAGGKWPNGNCSPKSTCDLRDYAPPWGDGSQARPLIVAGSTSDLHVFDFYAVPDVSAGYRFFNLELRGQGAAGVFGAGFYNGQTTDVLLCNLVFDGFAMAVSVNGASGPGRHARLVLRDSDIRHSTAEGFAGACSGCVIENNVFDSNGWGGQRASIAVASEITNGTPGALTVGMRVRGNHVYNAGSSGGACAATAIVVSGRHQSLVLEDNWVEAPLTPAAMDTCAGISVSRPAVDPDAASFYGLIIRRNRLLHVAGAGIRVNACDHCTIENNLVVGNVYWGIVAPDALHRPGVDATHTATLVRNNTVYLGPSSPGGVGIRVGGEGDGYVVTSNAIYYAGTGVPDGWSCFDLRPPLSSYGAVDYNACWFPAAAGQRWELGTGGLATWQAVSGAARAPFAAFDVHSLQQNPEFVDVAAPASGFAPGPTSPLAGAADPVNFAADDINKKTRDAAPDAGAFER